MKWAISLEPGLAGPAGPAGADGADGGASAVPVDYFDVTTGTASRVQLVRDGLALYPLDSGFSAGNTFGVARGKLLASPNSAGWLDVAQYHAGAALFVLQGVAYILEDGSFWVAGTHMVGGAFANAVVKFLSDGTEVAGSFSNVVAPFAVMGRVQYDVISVDGGRQIRQWSDGATPNRATWPGMPIGSADVEAVGLGHSCYVGSDVKYGGYTVLRESGIVGG